MKKITLIMITFNSENVFKRDLNLLNTIKLEFVITHMLILKILINLISKIIAICRR